MAKWPSLIAIFFGAAFAVAPAALARTWTVGRTNCDTASVAAALKLAQPGDRILIKPGTYKEGQLVVDKRLEIRGEDLPCLDGGEAHSVLVVRSTGVVVSGLRIQNTGASDVEDRAGIKLIDAHHCTVTGNVLGNNLFGIYLAHCRDCSVLGNRVQGAAISQGTSGNGIHLWHCSHIRIAGNQVSGQRDGIYLEFVDHSLIEHNTSLHNLRYGLHFMFSNSDSYRANSFANNGAGVAVMYSHHVSMLSNTFQHNWGPASYGLLLKEITDGVIAKNCFARNTIGIQCDGTSRLQVSRNDFLENGRAFRISSYCSGTLLTANNFIGNTFDLSSRAALNDVRLDKNYWSNCPGYDLDRNGISDVPYQPASLSCLIVDQYPAAAILLRSTLFDLLDLAERALPAFTPETLTDPHPLMGRVIWN